jgi:ribonuclease P protein component
MAKAPIRLKRRTDFLRARQGKQAHARGFVLQAISRLPASQEAELKDSQPRFGFTVSKRCGGAVGRNRIRRRLKEALRLLNPLPARPGYDYVILARPTALRMPFLALQGELIRALGKISARTN